MIVISLTTIDSRIELVKKTILSLLSQTEKPDVIHVFYSEESLFYDNGICDEVINALNSEIQIVNINKTHLYFTKTQNIGSYRKLIPALKIYKDDVIITVDDDHEHETQFIEKYMQIYNQHTCIVSSRARFIDLLTENTTTLSEFADVLCEPVMNIIPEGFGGILYHTSMFDKDFINFDYSTLSEIILKNDDVFFRMYTFRKNIKVITVDFYKNHLIDFDIHPSLYKNYNIHLNISDVIHEINKVSIIASLYNVSYKPDVIKLLRDRVATGTDVKVLQYEIFSTERCSTPIKLLYNNEPNIIMLNMEKDRIRYESCVEEFKKISIDNFIHLKTTFWKEKDKLEDDVNFILQFLNVTTKIQINDFSEASDSNIYIQDGPLACYCAHMRALIYGYLHFKEYTIIVEDDILIANTMKIEQYIKTIPDDWDIICFNSMPVNERYDNEHCYKFRNTFHSLHFYIVKNKCMPVIFQNVYPVLDQIDLLIARLYDKLNIYNIEDTMYQKNFSTSTQNNLFVIFNSPGYESIRIYIKEFEDALLNHIHVKLPDNEENNSIIMTSIMYDVIYNFIIHHFQVDYHSNHIENTTMFSKLHSIINCCVKGINIDNVVIRLLNDIDYILDCFTQHNNSNKAYRYGSTSNTYKRGDIITKVYNSILRWTHEGHDDRLEIFNREVTILKQLNRIIDMNTDPGELSFTTKYLGESLYDDFYLPIDWKEQITTIFDTLTLKGIHYPEFNIKNITVLDETLAFIDFGLASITESVDNSKNCQVFIELLDLLSTKNITNEKNVYMTFINNLKISKKYSKNIYT